MDEDGREFSVFNTTESNEDSLDDAALFGVIRPQLAMIMDDGRGGGGGGGTGCSSNG